MLRQRDLSSALFLHTVCKRSSCLVVDSYFIYFLFSRRWCCPILRQKRKKTVLSSYFSVSSHRVLFWEFFFSIPAGQTHTHSFVFLYVVRVSTKLKIEIMEKGIQWCEQMGGTAQQMKLKNKKRTKQKWRYSKRGVIVYSLLMWIVKIPNMRKKTKNHHHYTSSWHNLGFVCSR